MWPMPATIEYDRVECLTNASEFVQDSLNIADLHSMTRQFTFSEPGNCDERN